MSNKERKARKEDFVRSKSCVTVGLMRVGLSKSLYRKWF